MFSFIILIYGELLRIELRRFWLCFEINLNQYVYSRFAIPNFCSHSFTYFISFHSVISPHAISHPLHKPRSPFPFFVLVRSRSFPFPSSPRPHDCFIPSLPVRRRAPLHLKPRFATLRKQYFRTRFSQLRGRTASLLLIPFIGRILRMD